LLICPIYRIAPSIRSVSSAETYATCAFSAAIISGLSVRGFAGAFIRLFWAIVPCGAALDGGARNATRQKTQAPIRSIDLRFIVLPPEYLSEPAFPAGSPASSVPRICTYISRMAPVSVADGEVHWLNRGVTPMGGSSQPACGDVRKYTINCDY
jgi:hypothetical protein